MTGFTLPPIIVDYDANWLDVDLSGDLGEWARLTARDVVTRMPGRHGRRLEKHVVSVLEEAGAIAREPQNASIALLLVPDVRDRVKAVVKFCPVDLAGRDAEDAWAELLSALSTDDLPDVTEIPTGAGPCRRIRARYAVGEGSYRPVGEYLNYVWILPRWGAAVVMTTAFEDLLEAGRWRPVLDELAAKVSLEPGTQQAAGEVGAG